MNLAASCSTLAAPLVDGPVRQCPVLGWSSAALYVDAGGTVLAVLAQTAVQLPTAVLVPASALPVPPTGGAVRMGRGGLWWHSGAVPVRVEVVRRYVPARVHPVRPVAERVDALAGAVRPHRIDVATMLGDGPGLTPSGDDVLAGYLLGCRAFGLDATEVCDYVLGAAAQRTTALSAALLCQAVAGWCVPEAAALIRALGGSGPLPAALRRLQAVGSSSGTALAAGILTAALGVELAASV